MGVVSRVARQDVFELCERLLAMAKAGQLTGLIAVMDFSNGDAMFTRAGTASECAIQELAEIHDILRRADEPEDQTSGVSFFGSDPEV